MVPVAERQRRRAIRGADDERGDPEVAGAGRRVGQWHGLADAIREALERVRTEMQVRAAEREGGAEMELAERAVLVDPQDQAQAAVGEMGLAVSGPPLDGQPSPPIRRMVHAQR